MVIRGGLYLRFISSVLPIRQRCELQVLESHCSLMTAFGSRRAGIVSGVPVIQPGQIESIAIIQIQAVT